MCARVKKKRRASESGSLFSLSLSLFLLGAKKRRRLFRQVEPATRCDETELARAAKALRVHHAAVLAACARAYLAVASCADTEDPEPAARPHLLDLDAATADLLRAYPILRPRDR